MRRGNINETVRVNEFKINEMREYMWSGPHSDREHGGAGDACSSLGNAVLMTVEKSISSRRWRSCEQLNRFMRFTVYYLTPQYKSLKVDISCYI